MENSSHLQTESNHEEVAHVRQTLASLLKNARKSQGKTLEEISQNTGIGLMKLQALESGDRRGLPADVFVRGFIRMYSAQVGVDSQTALNLFEREWGEGAEDYDESANLLKGETFAKSSVILRRWPALVTIAVLATIVYLVSKFFFPALFVVPTSPTGETLSNELPEIEIITKSQQKPSTSQPEETDEEIESLLQIQEHTAEETKQAEANSSTQTTAGEISSSEPPVAAISQNTIETTDKAADTERSTDYRLNIKFKERTWIKIAIDGQPAQEEIFKQGSEKTWDAQKSIDLYLGNAGGATLSLNGEQMPLKQESGQTVRIQIPQDAPETFTKTLEPGINATQEQE